MLDDILCIYFAELPKIAIYLDFSSSRSYWTSQGDHLRCFAPVEAAVASAPRVFSLARE